MNFIKNLKIGARLIGGFTLSMFLTIVVGVLGLNKINDVNGMLHHIYEDNLIPIVDVGHFEVGMLAHYRGLFDIVLEENPAKIREKQVALGKVAGDVLSNIEKVKKSRLSETEKRLLPDMEGDWANYLLKSEKVIELALVGDKGNAAALLQSEAAPVIDEALEYAEEMLDYNVADAKASYDRSDEAVNAIVWLVSIIVLGAAVMSLAIGIIVTRSITRPIGEAVQVAETVAAGDLTSQIHASGKDETADLLRALKAMNESLVKIVGEVRVASDSIATGSEQIATGNADLSQRTEEQASNLEETAASMEELTVTVKQNADTARQASQLAQSASEAATRGGEVVGQVVTTMEDITQSSKKIADIISVIDSIAFQTNILALNAAVEAARAGEQGRGFAVVAGEVRNLAQKSAGAAKEIKDLITASVERVETGSQLVAKAGDSVSDIVTQVKRVNDLILEITAASNEQASGISQVGEAVNQLDQVTQQNAALVEESAAAADSLKLQASRLAEMVSVFNLGQNQVLRSSPMQTRAHVVSKPPTSKQASLARPRPAPQPHRLAATAPAGRSTSTDHHQATNAPNKSDDGSNWESF